MLFNRLIGLIISYIKLRIISLHAIHALVQGLDEA